MMLFERAALWLASPIASLLIRLDEWMFGPPLAWRTEAGSPVRLEPLPLPSTSSAVAPCTLCPPHPVHPPGVCPILHFYARGPNDPPGNQRCLCGYTRTITITQTQQEESMSTQAKRRPTKRAKKPTPPRTWIHVVPRGTGKGREWVVLENTHAKNKRGITTTCEATQREALGFARSRAKALWKDGQPVQVVLHAASGRVRADATFGRDPRATRG
jgi:hypothetical protein